MKRILFTFFLVFLGLGSTLQAQDTLRVMQYNILRYGLSCNVDIAQKTTWLRNVFTHYQPDILAVNEIGPEEAYAARLKLQALTYAPMDYVPAFNQTGSSLINRLFYHTGKLEFVRRERIGGNIRDVDAITLRDKQRAALGDTIELTCIIAHLKAGSSQSDQNQRAGAANAIMSWIASQGSALQNYLVLGDFNIGGAAEPAWRTFTFNSNASVNLQDPTGFRNGWGASTVKILTQAPTSSRNDCGVGGSLDDRYDVILASQAIMQQSARIGYIPGSYEALSNDGRTPFNSEINCSGNTSVPTSICGNIKQISDHLPIVMQLQLGTTSRLSRADWPGATLSLHQYGPDQNPVADVSLAGPAQGFQAELLDMQGRRIWQQEFSAHTSQFEIPLLGKTHGMYLLRLANSRGQQKAVKFSW